MAAADDIAPGSAPRQRLLDALAQSIRERGLQRTQITDIVRIARTSRRTFYECFPDKESCFLRLIHDARSAVQAEMLEAVDPSAPWTEQIGQAIDAFLAALERDPALTVTISRELPSLGPEAFAFQREGTEMYAQLAVQLSQTEEMQRQGVRPISLETAVMIVGGIGELIDRATFRGEPPRAMAPVIKAVVKAVLAPAPGQPAAARAGGPSASADSPSPARSRTRTSA